MNSNTNTSQSKTHIHPSLSPHQQHPPLRGGLGWGPRILKYILFSLATLLLVAIIMLAGLALWLRTDSARQMVFRVGIDLLQEKLQTKVKADSIGIELLKGQVRIFGIQVNDRQDSLLLHIDELHAGIVPRELFDYKVHVTDMELLGADARLWKDSLTNNYQFVIDAFKKKDSSAKKKNTSSKMQLLVDVETAKLQKVHVKWDVKHKQRKNSSSAVGAFDANHLDLFLNLKAEVRQPAMNKYAVNLYDMNIHDRASGLYFEQINIKALADKDKVEVGKMLLKLQHSQVVTQPFTIDLKKKNITEPFTLKAQVLLQDIAQPFAPALTNFTTPLQLTTQVSGPLSCLILKDILIQTPDKHLTLTAKGYLDGLFAHKEKLNLQFRDIDLKASHNMKEQIVMHFAKKMRLKMIRQMKAVGDIRFLGKVDILHKREIIDGKLFTRFGHVTTRFTIDGKTRYMIGFIETPSLEMGKLMNIDNLGPVKCRIDFDLNISRKTKRPATALPNGRLPMGNISARVYDAKYSTVTVPQVNLKLESDGSTAAGKLWMPGKMKGMSADVRYTQTDKEQSVWFNLSHSAQQWLLKESINMLKEKLQADVAADSINIHLFNGVAKLYGIRVKDRHDNPLFSLDTLYVSLNAQDLLHHCVHITHIGLHGFQAHLNKDSSETNFRFITQSFKKKHRVKKHTLPHKKKHFLELNLNIQEINIENMRIKWDAKDKPHKSFSPSQAPSLEGRAGVGSDHIDLLLNMQAGIRQLSKDEYAIDLRRLKLKDNASGLQIDDIHTYAVMGKGMLFTDSLHIKMAQSWIKTQPLTLSLKDMQFLEPFTLCAHVVLQDIAQPFAPVLAHFTTPLDMQARISGGINALHVDDILIKTPDGKMNLAAQGILKGIKGKKDSLSLRFHNLQLQAENETLRQLVMHFAKTVRLKMMNQLGKMGDVRFDGDFDILHKCQKVSGKLQTEFGNVETKFTLDGNTHIMSGYLDAPALEIGKFINVKHLGNINVHADFDFNVSTKSPRPATALPNGRLPQGELRATISNVKYGILHAKRIETNIYSDGSTATGCITIPRIVSDLSINFNYIQTDDQQHLKVRPKYRFHKFWKNWRLGRKKASDKAKRL